MQTKTAEVEIETESAITWAPPLSGDDDKGTCVTWLVSGGTSDVLAISGGEKSIKETECKQIAGINC